MIEHPAEPELPPGPRVLLYDAELDKVRKKRDAGTYFPGIGQPGSAASADVLEVLELRDAGSPSGVYTLRSGRLAALRTGVVHLQPVA